MQDQFDFGAQLRDDGMDLAISNADQHVPRWKEAAMSFIGRFPKQEFMTEDLREFAYKHGLEQPPSERAWGMVMAQASKEGIVKHIGYRLVKNPNAHRTPAGVWRKN